MQEEFEMCIHVEMLMLVLWETKLWC